MAWEWSFLCLTNMAGILALETVLTLVDGDDSPARSLALYFLGSARREYLPGCSNIGSSVVVTSVFYRSVLIIVR